MADLPCSLAILAELIDRGCGEDAGHLKMSPRSTEQVRVHHFGQPAKTEGPSYYFIAKQALPYPPPKSGP